MTNNKVTKEHIEQLIDAAIVSEHVFWDKEVVVSYMLHNRFTILGRGACVDPANFDIEIGRKVAREQAINRLWELEGYLLQNKLYEQHCNLMCERTKKSFKKNVLQKIQLMREKSDTDLRSLIHFVENL